ncbi:MAG: cell surface protein SprA [Ignavibacteriae bacterium]|nr:MAG: cell surface protein SprA [Ignavibacteriota bacterium]
MLIDSSFTGGDTTSLIDSSIVREPVDSTARIKYFKYERKDGYNPLFGTYTHPLVLYGSRNVDYKISFDSLDFVTISEVVNGEEIKYPLKIPFEKYIAARSSLSAKSQFYKIVADYYKIDTEDELGKLFKDITNIEIPLPFKSETIFGPPVVTLNINGLIDITASYQRNTSEQQTLYNPDAQNNINFKQDVSVTTKGSIGDKLTIDADWNSQRTFDFENQLKLKYKGYPDEVIQSIEAGNVSLETRSNLIGSTQALFGIKGQFKLGPLTMTAIASQKKSEKKEVNITGGSSETDFIIAANEYSDNHYFLDTLYRAAYEEYYRLGQVTTPALRNLKVAPDIEVWVQTTPNNQLKRKAVGWVNLEPKPLNGAYPPQYYSTDTSIVQGVKWSGYFVKLNPGDYTLHPDAGYISLNINLQNQEDAVGVVYKHEYPDSLNQVVQYGTYSNQAAQDSLIIKLVKFPNLMPTDEIAWKLKIRSIYDLKVKNIKNDASKFSLNAYFKPPSGEVQYNVNTENNNASSYLTRLNLDLRQANTPYTAYLNTGVNPDQQFDFYPGLTIDLTGGYVIFPTLQPFYTTLIQSGISADSLQTNLGIYTQPKLAVNNTNIKYFITGKAIGDATDRYNLGFNLVEGSVKIWNGSAQLTENVDFTIDYTTGELKIRNASALSAGANLKITYETNDLFQLASKTMLGTRLEYAVNKSSYIGFTLLNLKQQTLNDKIRIGEEPTNNTIIGFDAAADIKMNFLTKLVNKLPGYNTKEESKLTLNGEVAFMLPEPNTKKSRIPSDNNESVAYLDDFEGSKKLISLGMVPTTWSPASIVRDSLILRDSVSHYDSLMSIRRAKMQWYTLPNNVLITDVYPNKQIASNQNKYLSPLEFMIDPNNPGMFTYLTKEKFQLNEPNPRKRWTGIYKYLNTYQTNLLDENMNFIEIWMQINHGNVVDDSAKMMIDLGIISEKVISDSRVEIDQRLKSQGITYHTEDLNLNGTLDETEDVGLDGIDNAKELQIFGAELPGNDDPSDDNYDWNGDPNSKIFTKFNGTEGNSKLDVGKRIDTEDLNGDGSLEPRNNYFEYEIPLIADTLKNPYITGGNSAKNWYQFSIPLNEFKRFFGTATLTNIQYIRIWFKGMVDTTYISIVDMNLVGNQWQKSNKVDTSYSISVVNIEDNANYYDTPVQPPEILRQRDQTSTDQTTLLNEQSLSLEVRNLSQGQGKFASKIFNTRPIDLLNYKILKLFVNGDSTFRYTDTANYDAAVVIRFGSDTLNYYEYRAPVHPDKRPGSPWEPLNEVTINLADLTIVKQLRDSSNSIRYFKVPNGPPGAKYGVIGNPTISSISLIQLGVVNNHNPVFVHPISGSIWFNEMRVLKTDNKSGYAFTLGARLKLADLADLNFSYSKTDPHFHSLEGRFGSRVLSNNWEISGTFNLHKILNSMLSSLVSVKMKDFLTIPISFAHSESYAQPRFLPNTDIDLETAVANRYTQFLEQNPGQTDMAEYLSEQVRISAQTLSIKNRLSINGFKFTFPGDNFFVKEILNKIESNFSWASLDERTPTSTLRKTWELRGDVGLNANLRLLDAIHLNIGKFIPLGDEYKDAKLYFFFPFAPLAPFFSNNLNLSLNVVRSRGDEVLRNSSIASPVSRNFGATRNFTLDWKFIENWIIDLTGNYSFGAGSDLTFLETTNDSLRRQRTNGQIMDDIFWNGSLVNFGRDISYNQIISINPKFNIPILKNFVDLTSSYRVQYGWLPSQNENGNVVGYSSDFQTSAIVKLKSIFDLFKPKTEKIIGASLPSRQQQEQNISDILKLIGGFIPDQFNLTFSQSKNLTQPGVSGRPGFANFWMMWNPKENYGPSRLYQLGWSNYPGKRMPNLSFTDKEGYGNSLSISTFITPIFPNNLKISFTYKTTWAKDNQLGYLTNGFGDVSSPISVFNTRSLSRPIFFFTSVDQLTQNLAKPSDTLDNLSKAKQISESFENNIVSFPFPSWSLTLNGIEKFDMFSGFASSISFENSFNAEYKKSMKFTGIGSETIESQNITSGFSPLIGVNVTFKPVGEGNLTASLKINKTTSYDLIPSTPVLNNTSTSDLSINATYTKQGFKIPLFGLSLDNDISISFSYTRTKNDPRSMKLQPGAFWSNDALNGSISTSINPAILYALSKSVSVQLFYKYTKIEPTPGSNQVIERTSNEAGLNVKLTIQ